MRTSFPTNTYPDKSVLPLLKSVFMQDLTANPKCSLLVARDPEDRTDLVITLHGDAITVSYDLLFISLLYLISLCFRFRLLLHI